MLPRLAVAADAAPVVTLFERFMAEIAADPAAPPLEDYVRRAIDDELGGVGTRYPVGPRDRFWVLDDVGRTTPELPLLGTIGIEEIDGATAELRRLMVRPDRRRAGLGRALLGYAERSCSALGYERIVLETSGLQ